MFSRDDECGVFEFHAWVEVGGGPVNVIQEQGSWVEDEVSVVQVHVCSCRAVLHCPLNGFRSNWMVHMNVDKE